MIKTKQNTYLTVVQKGNDIIIEEMGRKEPNEIIIAKAEIPKLIKLLERAKK